jgi:hypothetical protein
MEIYIYINTRTGTVRSTYIRNQRDMAKNWPSQKLRTILDAKAREDCP